MTFLKDRLKERSTWAGIGTLIGLMPLGIYADQTQEALSVLRDNAPALIGAVETGNYVALVTVACAVIPAIIAIVWPTSRR